MEVEIARLIADVLTEATKILGPAAIASFATYKVTSIQSKLKIEELKRANSFKAKEHLLHYYENQQDRLNDAQKELQESLTSLLGFSTGYSSGSDKEVDDVTKTFSGLINTHIRLVPISLRSIIKEYESLGLNTTDEYTYLKGYLERIDELVQSDVREQMATNIHFLTEIYALLSTCNHSLLERKILELFGDTDNS
ncbi:hypothetical protein QWZ13_11685 [Reinekea marina]|uniref:Uncharacterized protein n=1 Tax=Reinekea marina TaxID=1310421 RepID=A0ABV7WUD0_9GAMM|nr:hypothetical protein [Reinekea marina]MDN3649577.1 hypothetical protein [Reinekea marina]